jgi:hypothetical protein
MQCKPAFNAECNFHKPAVCAAITNRLHDHFFYSLHPAAAMHLNAILRLRQPRAPRFASQRMAWQQLINAHTLCICICIFLVVSIGCWAASDGACGSVQKNAPGKNKMNSLHLRLSPRACILKALKRFNPSPHRIREVEI